MSTHLFIDIILIIKCYTLIHSLFIYPKHCVFVFHKNYENKYQRVHTRRCVFVYKIKIKILQIRPSKSCKLSNVSQWFPLKPSNCFYLINFNISPINKNSIIFSYVFPNFITYFNFLALNFQI